MTKEVQVLVRTSAEMREWLQSEKERTGRSQNWLINHALELWKDRLEKGREARKAD